MSSSQRLAKRILFIGGGVIALPIVVLFAATLNYSAKCGSARASCFEHRKAGCTLSGTYDLQIAGRAMDASCDMSSEGGGWTLVANYHHRATPKATAALSPSNERLPIHGSPGLGADETGTKYWGHAGTPILGALPFTEMRFKCQSSTHNRIVDFAVSSKRCLDYFRSGKGACLGTPDLREELTRGTRTLFGHTAMLPAIAQKGWVDQGSNATTNYPFFMDWKAHWAVGTTDNRWECDDVDSYARGGGNTTFHEIWVR